MLAKYMQEVPGLGANGNHGRRVTLVGGALGALLMPAGRARDRYQRATGKRPRSIN